MKYLFLNVYKGAKNRFDLLINFVNEQKPAVLCLSELNGWNDNSFQKLHEFKARTGFKNHCFAHSKKEYHLGIFSNQSIHDVFVDNTYFRTAFLKASIGEDDSQEVLLLHLDSRTEELRLKEVKKAMSYVQTANPLILGDLNSLSPADAYNSLEIVEHMERLGLHKFGNGEIRTDVINYILDHGLLDAVRMCSKGNLHTVPTPMNEDKAHFGKLRLDYIFVTKETFSKVRNASVIRDDLTDSLSDHYPVMIDLV